MVLILPYIVIDRKIILQIVVFYTSNCIFIVSVKFVKVKNLLIYNLVNK